MTRLLAHCRSALAAVALAFGATSSGAGPIVDPSELVVLDVMPGWTEPDGTRMAAIRLKLQPGWKTYWRSPGQSGVPPQFDWSGSENLRAVRFHWPRPRPFELYGMTTLGYNNELVLPIELFPKSMGSDMRISGRMALGVCRDICLPVTLTFGADLPADAVSTDAQPIRASLSDRPERGSGPALCQVSPIADGLRVTASFAAPSQGGTEVVVFEPGRGDLWISEAETDRRAGTVTATAEIVPPEGRPFALSRKDMRITLIGQNGAVEFNGCEGG